MKAVPPLAAVVLAAGDSQRMGRPKALLRTPAGTFLERAVALAGAAQMAPVRIVVGRAAAAIAEAHPHLAHSCVVNPTPELGQLHSLRLALASLPEGVEGAAVFLVDHPSVRPETVSKLARVWRQHPAAIVVPVHEARRGHPVIFPRTVWDELHRVPLEAGARAVVLADERRLMAVPVDDPGVVADIDTPEEYRQLLESRHDH